MVKKSRSTRRGIPQGVQRHTIRASKAKDGGSFLTKSRGKDGSILSSAAKSCHNSILKICTFLCLIPLQVSKDDKKFDFLPFWKRIVHFILVVFYVSMAVYRISITVLLCAEEGLNSSTILCGCSFLVLFLGICFALGSSWKTLELKDLLNSWESVRMSMEEVGRERVDIFSNAKFGFEITAMACGALLAGVNSAAFTLVLDDLPVGVFYTLKRLEVIPETPLQPNIVWKIGLFPLELLISLPPMFVAVFGCHVMMLGQVTLLLYADHAREMNMCEKRSWVKVEGLYRSVKLYNAIFMNWFRFVVVPVIFGLSVCTTASLYVTCRPSGLPVFMYSVFPATAAAALYGIFWMCVVAVVAKRTGDEVLGNLQSRTESYFHQLEPAEKKELMRRAKALQPVRMAMGEFAEVTMGVYVSILDEILNQLIFLLSL